MALLLLHLPTLALNAVTTLAYPLYSSYKALTSPSPSLASLETWLVYWSVFACFTLIETTFGFLISWVPFYYELRLLFNIWLVAPQTRGATWLYTNHLHPLLQRNQQQIDEVLEDVKGNLKGRLEGVLGGVWSASMGGSGEESVQGGGKEARHRPPGATAPAPPTTHNPAQAPASMLGNLIKTYAPLAVASAKTFLESKAPPTTTTAYSIPPSSSNPNDIKKREEAMQRRRQLESQLAALDASGVVSSDSSNSSDEAPVTLIHPKNVQGGGKGSLRSRIVSGGAGRQTVKAAMGESYDLLDQKDIPPLPSSPQRDGRGGRQSWIPWSPKDGHS